MKRTQLIEPQLRIGSQVDHDMRLYSFARRSGLPLTYFRPRRNVDQIVAWSVIACLAVGLAIVGYFDGLFV